MKYIIFVVLVFGTIFIPFFCKHEVESTFKEVLIDQDWIFRENETNNDWLPAKIPGTVQSDLVANKLLENPLLLDNEKLAIALENKSWIYKTTIDITQELFEKHHLDLIFKGLDTYCDIYINDVLVYKANNMFVEHKVAGKKHFHKGKNELKLIFLSATKIGMEKLQKNPYLVPAVNELADDDKKSSVFTRKAPYHYGWDWGPRIVTAGAFRPIVLRGWDEAHISSVYYEQKSMTKIKANFDAQIEIFSVKKMEAMIQVALDQRIINSRKILLKKGTNIVKINIDIPNAKLWWPNGLGDQPLYALTAKLFLHNQPSNEITKKVGVRTIGLVQAADSVGKLFKFKINGQDVFIKGANYIPGDNILTDVTIERYQKVIAAAKDANMNMLRVWGGGIYENDEFYDLCDKNGLLVWQDFMFACSMTPGDTAHLQNIKNEFEDNVKRIRQHPSLALWCGNNENMVAWFDWDLQKKYKLKPQDSTDLMLTYSKIFYGLIPKTLQKYDSTRAYWPSSPSGGFGIKDKQNPASGDVHDWSVWFSKTTFEQAISQKKRFISEYGLQSYPERKTIQAFANNSDTIYDAKLFDYKQRSTMPWLGKDSTGNVINGNDMVMAYIKMYYNVPKNFDNFLYLSQLVQADGLKTMIEGHRSHKPYCWGSMYWQLNDCWPTISWSSMDYYFRWKAAHYAVKKAYHDLIILPKLMANNLQISVLSDKMLDTELIVGFQVMDFKGNILAKEELKSTAIANENTIAFTKDVEALIGKANRRNLLIYTYAKSNNGEIYTDNILLFELPKNIVLEKPIITKKITPSKGGFDIELQSNVFVKALYLKNDAIDVFFSTNYFDLLPNVAVIIHCETTAEKSNFEKDLMLKSLADM